MLPFFQLSPVVLSVSLISRQQEDCQKIFHLIKGLSIVNKTEKRWFCVPLKHSFPIGQHMPHPLMTYSSSSGSTGSNDFIPGMKDLRRSSSQISLSSSIQSNVYANVWKVSLLKLKTAGA